MANVKSKDTGLVKEIQKALLDDTDFLRNIVQENLQKFLTAEFTEHIQATPYERTGSRRGYRNGSYTRKLTTRVGTIELDVIRDREGNFSTELFRRYQRNEQAFALSLIEMYIQGVSTRKVKHITEILCGRHISKSTVSALSKEMDATISRWRNRRLTQPYPYLVIDARYEDIRKDGIVMSQAVLIVVGIGIDDKREILSVELADSENQQDWAAVFDRLKDRGLQGVEYIVSDDHKGLVKSIKQKFQGAAYQRCQVHFMRNLMSKLSRKESKGYILKLKDIFSAPTLEQARKRKDGLVSELALIKPNIAEWLDDNIESCFSVYALPEEHRKRMRTTNMLERFNQELLRRSRVIRIFPNEESCLRLFGALCMEQSEQWQTGYQYLDMSLKNKQEQKDWTKLARAV